MPRRQLRSLLALVCLSGVLMAGVGSNLWLDVPFVKQDKNGCGAASVAMIIEYWRRQQGQVTATGEEANQIQRLLYSEKAHGIYASDLERYLSDHGFRTFPFRGEWSDIGANLAKGRPLLLALKPDRSDALHYVVVAGVDEQQGIVLINDPARRKLLKQDRSDFEKQWRAAGNWTLLAVPDQ
ncbi:MAG: C39 family peptidase [Acidobacteria bacterium]|nr:C39 family peptidase [Acidobacteriota bacterium]